MPTYRAGAIVTIGLLALASTGAGAPTVQSMTPPAGSAVGSLTQISISFNEAVANVDADDLLVNGESAAAMTGSGAGPYVFIFTQPAPGTINVSWDLDHGMAGIGTGNFVAPAPWSYTLNDTVPPAAGQLTPAAGSTVGTLTQLEVVFSEPVTGVEAADLLVNGQPALSVTGSGLGPYLFAFPLPAFGTVDFAWKIDDTIVPPRVSIFDAAGNAVAGSAWSVTRRAEGIGTLVITEFLAANGTGLADENADQEDWMEIHNPGATAVNLTGWALTNEADQFGKWVFPNWSLDPGRFIVVFASGKDRRPTQRTAGQDNANTVASPRLHANFKLNENGDYLALVGPQSPRAAVSHFTPEFPAQRFNYSYGTVAGGALRYFATPTPGVANGASALTALTPPPATSVERGFFSEPFSLVLTCADGSAVIRYTTNGDEPTVATGTVYGGPINITTTTVLRVAAFATNSIPSRTVTQSYIFLDAVLNQPANPAGFPNTWGTNGNFPGSVIPADYAMDMDPVRVDPNNPNSPIDAVKLQRLKDGLRELPIMSLVLKTNDMFGAGGLYPTSSASNKAPNEKACSVEMILPDGSTAFSTTCGLRLHGNASRDPHKNPKHGFKLNFKGDYGAATLEYRLFPDSPVEEFDDLILRPDFNSSWRHWSDDAGNGNGAFQRARGTRTRDAWVKESQRTMGGVASHNRYVHLFINGLYWGTFDASEQPTADFAAAYLGGNEATMDIYDQGALKNGTATAYNAMSALSSLAVNNNYEQMKRYLDLPEFIDYMMLHFFFGHQDWGVNKNWYAIRRADGTFKYVAWDGECVLLETNVNRVTNTDVPTNLHTRLVANAQYKLDFADRIHRHMIRPNGTLTPAMNIARWQKWQAVMDKPVVAESARWGDYRRDVHPYQTGSYLLYTRENHWVAENNRLVGTYFPNRTNTVLGQLRSAGLYPSLNAPEFRDQATNALLASSPVAAGFQLKMALPSPAPAGTTSAGTIYYTTDGTDPRVIYSGAVSGGAQAFTAPLTLNNSTRLKARALNGTTWSALNEAQFTVGPLLIPIVITEVMHDPPEGPAHEFVELTNTGSEDINLSGFYFEGVEFVFPFGAVLGAGTRIVVASNNAPASFAVQYPGIIVAGYFGGSLQNEGERIALKAPDGSTVTSLRYADALPWPPGAAGDGYSLEIVDEDGDANSPFNWKASGGLKGTPGTPNSATSRPAIEITEILAENIAAVSNGGFFSDYIELHNTTAAAIDISGWSLITDSSYLFPPGASIPAGTYMVVWFDNALAAPGFHTGGLGSLLRAGGSVQLRLPDGRTIVDGLRYGNQIPDASLGLVGGEWTLTQPSPGAFNSTRPTASLTAHLVFNEWLAAPDDGGRGWIEVHNKHASLPVALRGVIFKNGVFSDRYDIPAFVAPLGHLQLFTDEGATVDSLDFLLSPAGASLQLLDEDGGALDAVTFATQTTSVSGGRLPDGAVTLSTFPNGGSPGASNYAPNNGGPVINELLARNVNGEAAPWGTRADWVELHNPATTATDISGMRLGYRNDFSQAWRIPAATTIPGGGHLAIWCDPDRSASTENSAEMNSGLPLSDDKGALYLFNAAGQLVDTVAWGFQIADLSVGRTPAAGWRLLTSPTRRTTNATAALLGLTTNLRINEWFDNGNGTDWFELYNRDAAPVELSGLYLTDNPSEPGLKKFRIASLSFIAARGWVQFFGEGSPPAGRSQVNFGIEAEGEYLRLSGAELALIDAVSFGAQILGKSQGRVPDGEVVQGGLMPTPAATNSALVQITDHPHSETVAIGGTVTFRVTVSGAGPFTYQWRFKGDALPAATGDSLMRSNVTFTDDGDYEVSVSNAAGTVVSQPAILFVQHTYAQWKALFFSSAEQANELVSGANADADGDGIPNGQEYFHNFNPRAEATSAEQASALPRAGVEPASGPPQFVTLTYRRSNRTTAASVIYQSSKGLEGATWEPLLPDAVEQLGPDLFSDDPRIRVKFAIQPLETRRFLRLIITP